MGQPKKLRLTGTDSKVLLKFNRIQSIVVAMPLRTKEERYITTMELQMIPPFDPVTGYLPPGEHRANWHDFVMRFGGNSHRKRLLDGIRRMASNLREAGCKFFLVDGSFVTTAEAPADFDACCDFSGINIGKVDLRLFAAGNERLEMKAEYFGELFPEHYMANGQYTFREFFQSDRDGIAKGIVRLELETLP
jgi:hypothetical protein